jgi:tripartite-type tricarboxylate transporter receptor subunit TctC
VLAVRSTTGASTLAGFVADAKARPDTMTIGSAGVGTLPHLMIELLKREAGVKVIHVPFRGMATGLPALLGGQIDALFIDIGVIAPQLTSGALRALAVGAEQRVAALPDVPTTAEAGLPGVIGEVWFGYVVAAKTPPAIVKRLQDALAAAHDDAAYQASLARLGASAGERGPDSLARLIAEDTARWRAVIAGAGIRLE